MNKNWENCLMLILAFTLLSQKVLTAQDVNVKIGLRDSIKSDILGESRNILIHLPNDYFSSNKSYPVIYQVKGDTASMLQVVSTVNRLAHEEEITPEMIIVAIETVSGKDLWPRDTITAIEVNKFQSFIEKELIPYIENKYRTTDDRILYGQSMTAVFTLYTFITKPKLFNSYIASSGAFPYCENFFKELSLKSFQQSVQYNGQKIFITNGLKDHLIAQVNSLQQMTDFSNLVKEKIGNRVRYKYLTYENEGHVPFHSLYDGLKFVFESNSIK